MTQTNQSTDDRRAARPLVLVVDPDRDAREIAQRVLARAGFATIATGDPHAALTIVPELRARVIVAELYLCAGDETCILRTLRRLSAPAHSRILVYTVHAREQDRMWALAGGCDAFLCKPVPTAVLLAHVARLAAAEALLPS